MRHETHHNQAGSSAKHGSKGVYNDVDQCRAWDMARQQRAHYFSSLVERLRRHKKVRVARQPSAVHYVHGSARPHAS